MPPKMNDGFTKQQRYKERRKVAGPKPGRRKKYRDGLTKQRRSEQRKANAELPCEKRSGVVVVHKKMRDRMLGTEPPASLAEIALTTSEYSSLVTLLRTYVSLAGSFSVLICGGLMGLLRPNIRALLPWDDDVDFAILESNVKKLEDADWKNAGLVLSRGPSYCYRICFQQGGTQIPVQLSGQFTGRFLEHTWPVIDVFLARDMGNGLCEYKGGLHRNQFPREAGLNLQRTRTAELHGVIVRIPGNAMQWLDKAYPGWRTRARAPAFNHRENHCSHWNAEDVVYAVAPPFQRI